MNQFQIKNCVLEWFARGLREKRQMGFPAVLFTVSLVIAVVISQANGQNNMMNNNNDAKKGIMCYVCNSARDPRCGDPFDPATIEKVDCEQYMPNMNTTVCRKSVQKAMLGSREDLRVIRTCGYLPETSRSGIESEDDDNEQQDRCYNKAGTFEVQVTYCACHADGCNPAPRQARSSLTFVSQTGLQLATMIAGSYLMLKDKTGFY